MNKFEDLIEHFLKFPGIGPRQAKRFAYFLSSSDNEFIKKISELILEVKKETKQCKSCYRLFHTAVCSVCSDLSRDNNLLMVVEKDVDFENIEKTGVYNGKYFILGGIVSFAGNSKLENLNLKQLFEKIKSEHPKEIILATSATIEGENTARYVEKILEPFRQAQGKPIKITRLGRGLSTGTELEYIDSETINNALKNRK